MTILSIFEPEAETFTICAELYVPSAGVGATNCTTGAPVFIVIILVSVVLALFAMSVAVALNTNVPFCVMVNEQGDCVQVAAAVPFTIIVMLAKLVSLAVTLIVCNVA